MQDLWWKDGDVSVHAVVQGEGEPVLLLHGWGGRADSFKPVAEGLETARKVYRIDFPGFGESGTPGTVWDVTDYAESLARWMKAQGLEKTDIVAHSFGGRVSIVLSASYPELVGKLVLVDSAGIIPKRTLGYRIRVALAKAGKSVLNLPGLRGSRLEKTLRRLTGSADYRDLNGTMREIFVKVINQDLEPFLTRIQASTLLVWGENDKDTPVSFGQTMEKKIPDAGLVILPGAGHFSYLDQFPWFMKILKNFLGVTPS